MAYFEEHDFESLGIQAKDEVHLRELEELAVRTEKHLSVAMQFPESGFFLDLESRRGSPSRQFAHIHQMCLLHATHFEVSNKIKSAYLLDFYLWAAGRLNPMAVYNAARSILELHAMLSYISGMLREAASGNDRDWLSRGVDYFGIIMRARFGTTDRGLRKQLCEAGVPEEYLEMYRVRKARKALGAEVPWLDDHYVRLCDFVHHNLLSQRTAGAHAGVARQAVSETGGKLILSEQAAITQYGFPMPEPGRKAINDTVERTLVSVRGIVSALNQMPHTPFSESELMAWTGTTIGLDTPPSSVRDGLQIAVVGRNDACPCGSGRKFKKCHGRTSG